MNLAERIASFRALLETDPGDAVLRLGLGLALLESGEAEGARAQFSEAVRSNPDYTAAWRELGRALEALGRKPEAGEAWRQGIEVAGRTGDLQAGKEMEVFRKRLALSPRSR